MTTNDTFDLQRLSHLIMNDLRIHAKTILIASAALVVCFALLPFHVTGNSASYFFILYTGGFIISSSAFNDLHDNLKAHLYLTLPCSNLERFLNKWLLTSIGYAIGLLIVYYLFSLLSSAVNLMAYNQRVNPLNILQPDLWIGIGKYIILQSVVFLGAIIFKKQALLKTTLAVGGFFLALSVFSVMISWMFCPNCIQTGFIIYSLMQGGYFLFWVVAAPFCWYLTYLRLSERELL